MTVKNYKLKSINPLFEVYKIPFNVIEKANISLKDKDNTWSLKEHSDEQGWDIAVNGAMFSNGNKATDKYYYWNITDLVVKGVFNRGGNYSNKGIAFGNPFDGVSAYWSTTENCIGKSVDFIGGAPTLIIDGKINMDMKGLGSSFATNMTQRTAIGVDKYNIYILTTRKNKANLTQVANELIAHGCLNALDLDGGGSTAIKVGDDYFTQGRNITSAFGIRLSSHTNPIQPQKPQVDTTVSYTVKKGDSLSKIAQIYGIPYKTIAANNNIKAPFYIIKTGQVLKIK